MATVSPYFNLNYYNTFFFSKLPSFAHGRWFSPGTTASSTTKTGRHDIVETQKIKSKIKSLFHTDFQQKITTTDVTVKITVV